MNKSVKLAPVLSVSRLDPIQQVWTSTERPDASGILVDGKLHFYKNRSGTIQPQTTAKAIEKVPLSAKVLKDLFTVLHLLKNQNIIGLVSWMDLYLRFLCLPLDTSGPNHVENQLQVTLPTGVKRVTILMVLLFEPIKMGFPYKALLDSGYDSS